MKINVNKITRQLDVDNRIPLRNYYRIADSLLRQANIYREEKNVIDLYVILLRFSSLVSETIPLHHDYQVLFQKERATYKKRLLPVLGELEILKPEFKSQVEKINKGFERAEQSELSGCSCSSTNVKEFPQKYDNYHVRDSSSSLSKIDSQFHKLWINLPPPKQETLSRHSFFGPNGLHESWLESKPERKVQYPSHTDIFSSKTSSNALGVESAMESVLSLDDGRWLKPMGKPCEAATSVLPEDPFQFTGIRQPSPPPVLVQLQQELAPIPPSMVADPRPGLSTSSIDGMPSLNSYQHLHVPVNLMMDFLRLVRSNTDKNLETCGVLAGSLKNRVFQITKLIIPKQVSTSDSCQTLNEEEIFEVHDKFSLFPLGWIHTHPSQSCFMSSVDLHTHYSYQVMLPEAIAVVMAPTDESSPHGIFHLSEPAGVTLIRNCEQRGFHPHEEPSDGSSIYEHCSHVYMNTTLTYDVVDLR